MRAVRHCWWCGYHAEVDTETVVSNGLERDDSTADGSESWICADHKACERRAAGRVPGRGRRTCPVCEGLPVCAGRGMKERTKEGIVAELCGDYLMEDAWEEGFTCSLPAGHEGAHRDMTDHNEVNIGTDKDGRKYEWAYEWAYTDAQ